MTPGADQFSIQPDGLWLAVGPHGQQASYCDCIVVESCNTGQNLHDKRARYSARTLAMLIDFRRPWLDQVVQIQAGAQRSRRLLLGCVFPTDQGQQVGLRYLRVLYALPEDNGLYERVRKDLAMEAHEYICPQNRLGQWTSQPVQDFLQRMAPHRQRMT